MALGISTFLIAKEAEITLITLDVILYLKERGTFAITPWAFNFAKILVRDFKIINWSIKSSKNLVNGLLQIKKLTSCFFDTA